MAQFDVWVSILGKQQFEMLTIYYGLNGDFKDSFDYEVLARKYGKTEEEMASQLYYVEQRLKAVDPEFFIEETLADKLMDVKKMVYLKDIGLIERYAEEAVDVVDKINKLVLSPKQLKLIKLYYGLTSKGSLTELEIVEYLDIKPGMLGMLSAESKLEAALEAAKEKAEKAFDQYCKKGFIPHKVAVKPEYVDTIFGWSATADEDAVLLGNIL